MPQNMKSICITGYQRPQLFQQLLESLAANDLKGWQIEIQLAPSEHIAAFQELAQKYLPPAAYHIQVNETRLGVRLNPFTLLNRVFSVGATTIIYLEEDLAVADDITRLAA